MLSWIDRIALEAFHGPADARVVVASLPLPHEKHALARFRDLPSQVVPLAWHAGPDGPSLPRQTLLLGLAHEPLPDRLALAPASRDDVVSVTPGGYAQTQTAASGATVDQAPASWTGPRWSTAITWQKKTGMVMNEEGELVFTHQGRSVALRMGALLDVEPGFRAWEWLQVEELWSGPVCRAIRCAGYIGAFEIDESTWCDPKTYNSGPWLHKHNWLHAEIYALLFANGLIRITARHVNNRFFDQGLPLQGLVPVLALRTGTAAPASLPGDLDGSRLDFDLGTVQLDISGSSDLFGPEHPASLKAHRDLAIFQPYQGVEMDLGNGEPVQEWKLLASEHGIWKGMARSFSLDLTLADQPIRTRRYLPPYGWQAQAGALWSDRVLPADGNFDPVIDRVAATYNYGKVSHRFSQPMAMVDGEHAYVQLRQAHRTRDPRFFLSALHHAYALADLGVDHTDFTIRIGGMRRNSIAMPLQRTMGLTAAYLETGDPYLLRMAISVADAAYAMDRSNWPRRSYGRDGASIRSWTHLYDVTGEAFYLRRAGDACRRAAQCQRPDGSFGDQGATYGSHGHLSQIIKPWMNSVLSHAMVDYLERAGSDPAVEQAVQRCADWLLSVQISDADGVYWPYEVAWGDNEEPPYLQYQPNAPRHKHPSGEMHLDYNARTLLWVSERTGDPRYAQAWRQTYERHFIRKNASHSVYSGTKTVEDLPWHEAHLWRARWTSRGLKLEPLLDFIEIGRTVSISLPDGDKAIVRRTEDGFKIEKLRAKPPTT